jgi:Secretion system C-terminal sorting domain
MKQIFTLIIAGLMTVSGTGQNFANSQVQRNQKFNENILATAGNPMRGMINQGQLLKGKLKTGNRQTEKSRALMQQLDNIVNQNWDEAGMEWVNSDRNDFTYDAFGNNISDIYAIWNPDTELYDLSDKQEFNYEDGQMTEQVYYEYDNLSMEWVASLQWLYSYNAEGNITISYSYYMGESSWEMAGREERTYADNGLLIMEVSSFWNPSTSEWMNSSKVEHTYNSSGYRLTSTFFGWNIIEEEWVNSYRIENTYEGDFLVSSFSFTWSFISSDWENEYKNEYSYDGDMNMTQNLESEWDGSAWITSWKGTFEYNNDYTFDELVLPWYANNMDISFMHMITATTEYEGAALDLASRSLFNYSEVEYTGVPVNEFAQATVYPQPASGEVTFTWADGTPALELSVFDIGGKLVLEQRIAKDTPVSINSLAPGLYIYKLAGNNSAQHTGKLSVR